MDIILPYANGMDYGIGIDSLTGQARGLAVTGTGGPVAVTNAGGQAGQFHVVVLDSVASLQSTLGVSVDAKATYGMFGGSAQVDFVQQSNFSQYGVFLMIYVEVKNAFLSLPGPKLSPSAQKLYDEKKFDTLFNDFGDTFIIGQQSGGFLAIVLEVHAYSSSEQDSLTTKLGAQGNVGVFSGSLSAQFVSTYQQISSTNQIQFHYTHNGGTPPQSLDADSLIAAANAFPASVAGDQSATFTVLAQDYGVLGLELPSTAVRQAQQGALSLMWTQQEAFQRQLADIDYVIQNSDEFVAPDTVGLNQQRQTIANSVNSTIQAEVQCAADATKCAVPATTIPAVVLPQRQPQLRVLTQGLPEANCGASYQTSLEHTGGVGTVLWSQISGALPAGLSLNAFGTISGAPDSNQPEGVESVFKATDSKGHSDSTPPLRIHLRNRILPTYTGRIDQNSSGVGARSVTYVFPRPEETQGVIDASSVHVDQEIDKQQANGQVTWTTQINTTNVIVTVHTGALGGGHHAGHALLTVTFTYRSL